MSPSNSSSWPKAISFADCFSLSLAPSISPLFLHVTHLAKSAGPTTVTSFPNQLRWSLTSAANMCQGRLPAQLTLSLPLSLSLRLPLFSSISCVRAEWSGSQKRVYAISQFAANNNKAGIGISLREEGDQLKLHYITWSNSSKLQNCKFKHGVVKTEKVALKETEACATLILYLLYLVLR